MADDREKTNGSAADPIPGADPDPSGQDRITRNVLASWAGHLVFIVAGFVLPRVIDHRLGQAGLGVWDFGWSVVSYFGLVQAGVGSSVNRYVARYRAAGNAEALRCATASVNCVFLVAAGIIAVLAVVVAALVPELLSARLGEFATDARWVVLLLGFALAIQVALLVFNGTITGCHRWDLHNGITAGFYAASVAAMITALLLGGRLRSLALAYLGGVVLTEITRVVVAYRVCPVLSIRVRYARWSAVRPMMVFGGKTFLPRVSELLLNQTTSILIVSYLGPAALALFARPRALVQHVRTLVGKFAFVLTPTVSSLQARQDQEQIRHLLINTTRYAAYIALPMVLVLAVFGGWILRIWMGPDYAQGLLLAILALGLLATVIHQTVFSILSGLNMHGRPGVARLLGAIATVGLAVLALGPLRWGLVGTAMAVALPLVLVDGIYLPLYACSRIGVPLRMYLSRAYRGPIGCAIPFLLCLTVGSVLFADQPLVGFVCGLGAGAPVLALAYWKHALPERIRARVGRRVDRVVTRLVGVRL